MLNKKQEKKLSQLEIKLRTLKIETAYFLDRLNRGLKCNRKKTKKAILAVAYGIELGDISFSDAELVNIYENEIKKQELKC